MSYSDYFTRGRTHPEFPTYAHYYTTRLGGKSKFPRDISLVNDCFGPHVEYINPLVTELHFSQQIPLRWITEDELGAFFINSLYEAPSLLELSSVDNPEQDFKSFVHEICSSPMVESPTEQLNIGSNRLRFVIGEPGSGKSAFASKLIAEISRPRKPEDRFDSNYGLLCVRVNLEAEFNYNKEDPKPLDPRFLTVVYSKLLQSAKSRLVFEGRDLPSYWNQVSGDTNPALCIQSLINDLKRLKFRVVLFIDNIDFYEFYRERYVLFESHIQAKAKFINDNLLWLKKELSPVGSLGNLGLCVIITLREPTFKCIFNNNHATDTTHFSSTSFKLPVVSHHKVISSRLDLLSQAIKVVTKSRSGKNDRLENLLHRIHERLKAEESDDGALALIYRLGQHRHRSLVQFFSNLNFAYDEDALIERFFAREPKSLLEIFLNSGLLKYTQDQRHFPNLFLNDCMVLPDAQCEEAHRPHRHTYWLKYFVTAYIARTPGCNFDKLEKVFCQSGCYEPHLLKLVTGSLCTSNEFCCLRLSTEIRVPLRQRAITLTERGEALLSTFVDVPFFLSYRYLAAVVDDYLLALPNPAFDKIYDPTSNAASLYDVGDAYLRNSANHVRKKAVACLNFLHVLEDALAAEIKHGLLPRDKRITAITSDIDFRAAEKSMISTVVAIINRLQNETSGDEFRKALEQLCVGRRTFGNFWDRFYQSGHLVET